MPRTLICVHKDIHLASLLRLQSRVSIVDSIFFAVRVIKVWNSLPYDVVAADRLSIFICRLKHTNLSQFILGKV